MAQLNGHEERRAERLYREGMVRLTALARDIPDTEAVCQAVLSVAREVMGANWVAAFLLDAEANATGAALLHIVGESLPPTLDEDATALLFGGEPARLRIRERAGSEAEARVLRHHQLQWSACAPFTILKGTRGALVAAGTTTSPPPPDHVTFLESFADVLALLLRDAPPAGEQGRGTDAQRMLWISQEIATATTADEFAPSAAQAVATAFEASVALYLRDDDHLRVAAVAADVPANRQRAEFKASYLIRSANNPIQDAVNAARGGSPLPPTWVDLSGSDTWAPLRDMGCNGIMVAPLAAGSEPLGAIVIFRDLGEDQSGMETRLPQIVRIVVPALYSMVLQHELRARMREAEAIRRINQVAWQSADPEESVDLVARSVQLLFDADYVALFEITDEQGTWTYTLGECVPTSRTDIRSIPNDWLHARIRNLKPGVIRELGVDPDIPAHDFPMLEREGLVSAIIVPFRLIESYRGNLVLGYRALHPISYGEIRFARSIAQGVIATLMMRRLHAQSSDVPGSC